MQRKKVFLLSALGVAVALLLAAEIAGLIPARVQNFGLFDNTPLARVRFVLAMVPWVVFGIYWEHAPKSAVAAKSSESKASRGFHVVLANVAVVLEIIQISGLDRFLPVSAVIMAAGFVVAAMGLFLAIWTRGRLGRNWSGEISIKVEHQLIRSGPYKSLRHPIYSGLLMMYAGTALVTGTWLALVGLAIAIFTYWRKIRLEEGNLRLAFGAEYEAYSRETWALLPGVF